MPIVEEASARTGRKHRQRKEHDATGPGVTSKPSLRWNGRRRKPEIGARRLEERARGRNEDILPLGHARSRVADDLCPALRLVSRWDGPTGINPIGFVDRSGLESGILDDLSAWWDRVVGGSRKAGGDAGDALEAEARSQVAAASGAPIQWHFAEEAAANATRSLFAEKGITGIEVLFTP
jgi:hypothetical protein